MDIKLKSFNKRQMEILLTILWMSVFMAITFAVIFQNYLEFDYYWSGRAMQFYRISSIVLMILSLIIGAEAIRMTLRIFLLHRMFICWGILCFPVSLWMESGN